MLMQWKQFCVARRRPYVAAAKRNIMATSRRECHYWASVSLSKCIYLLFIGTSIYIMKIPVYVYLVPVLSSEKKSRIEVTQFVICHLA